MNILFKTFCLVALITIANFCSAQSSRALRPDLFGGFSQKMATPLSELDKAFTAKAGTPVALRLSDQFSFSGIVFSSVTKFNSLSTVIIKSAALHNTLLCISKRINDDNSVTYVGRIINEQYGDGYELKKDVQGNYSFNKIRTADLIQDY